MAQAIAENGIYLRKLNDVLIESSGTAGYHVGEPPDNRTLITLQKHDIHFQHRARKFNIKDFHEQEWLFPMDSENENTLRKLSADIIFQTHIVPFRLCLPPPNRMDIPDPFYGSIADFEFVFQLLEMGINNILDTWEQDKNFLKLVNKMD